MFKTFKILLFLLIIIFFSESYTYSQKDVDKQKAEFIHKFPRYLDWPDGSDVIKVGILGGSNRMLRYLRKYDNRSFKVSTIQGSEEVDEFGFDMLYVGKSFTDDIETILRKAKINNIIIISDGWGTKKLLMLNFVTKGSKVSFEINSRNINETGVAVSANIKKAGAIVIDDRFLFEESEKHLIEEKERVRIQKEELKMQQIKLEYQLKKINRQESKIAEHKKEIDKQLRRINNQRKELETLLTRIKNQTKELSKKSRELDEKTIILREKEVAIEEQNRKITEKQIEVEEQNKILDQQNDEISERQSRITKQKLEIAAQTGIIRTQKNALTIFTVLFVIIVALVIFIFRSLKTQKKQNKLLAERKEEIEQQAKQLENANAELAKLSLVASETSNAVAILNKEGEFEWVNAGFTRMYGYTLQLLQNELGTNIKEISTFNKIDEVIEKCVNKKSSLSFESEITTRDSTNKWTQTTISPTLNTTGEAHKLVLIDTDITDAKKAEAEIAKQNKQITSSILYAKRIQNAVLSPVEIIDSYLPEHYIMFRPRDIVSGDFYWAAEKDNKLIVTAADCTGHGVPGAFMSMLGITFLNQIIAENRDKVINANYILDELRDKVKSSLRQTGKEGEAKDGMDMSLCIIDKDEMKAEFSGAQNSLVLIRDGQITEYKGDMMPIGISYNEIPFKNKIFDIQTGDIIYMYSDGYPDQFHHKTKQKFYSKRLKLFLQKIGKKSLKEQGEILEETFDDWKGDFRQIDDVIVVGLRI